jgi:hypothetical protein
VYGEDERKKAIRRRREAMVGGPGKGELHMGNQIYLIVELLAEGFD